MGGDLLHYPLLGRDEDVMKQEQASDLPLALHQLHHGTFVYQLPVKPPTQLLSQGEGANVHGSVYV